MLIRSLILLKAYQMRTTFIAFAILLILGMIQVQVERSSVIFDVFRNRMASVKQSTKEMIQTYSFTKPV